MKNASKKQEADRIASEAREQLRMPLVDKITDLIEQIKSHITSIKNNDPNNTVSAQNTLSKCVTEAKDLLEKKCVDGTNLVTVKMGRDKLNDVVKKAMKMGCKY